MRDKTSWTTADESKQSDSLSFDRSLMKTQLASGTHAHTLSSTRMPTRSIAMNCWQPFHVCPLTWSMGTWRLCTTASTHTRWLLSSTTRSRPSMRQPPHSLWIYTVLRWSQSTTVVLPLPSRSYHEHRTSASVELFVLTFYRFPLSFSTMLASLPPMTLSSKHLFVGRMSSTDIVMVDSE